MKTRRDVLRCLGDERAIEVLERLHGEARRKHVALLGRFLPYAGHLLFGRRLPWDRIAPRMADMPLSVEASDGVFAYLLARALRARTIVEFGTSHGISTIYFALAVRDNGGGVVIGTEMVKEKAALARKNFAAAGVESFIDLRVGDALQTLQDVEGPIDLLFNDGFPKYMLPVVQMLAPKMREGALVTAGNVNLFPADHSEYVAWMRDPSHGFQSAGFSTAYGGEVSVKAHGRSAHPDTPPGRPISPI